jgi:hypothetical protein
MGSESVGEISRPERKLILGGHRFQNLVRLFSNQSQGDPCYHSSRIWQVARSCHPVPQEGDIALGPGRHIFVGEQFWGRAVQASRDSLDPGRFLFVAKFKGPQVRRGYFPGSSENNGTSSLLPDDKLR